MKYLLISFVLLVSLFLGMGRFTEWFGGAIGQKEHSESSGASNSEDEKLSFSEKISRQWQELVGGGKNTDSEDKTSPEDEPASNELSGSSITAVSPTLGQLAEKLFTLPEIRQEPYDIEPEFVMYEIRYTEDLDNELKKARKKIDSARVPDELREAYVAFWDELTAVNKRNMVFLDGSKSRTIRVASRESMTLGSGRPDTASVGRCSTCFKSRGDQVFERNRVINRWKGYLTSKRPEMEAAFREIVRMEKGERGGDHAEI